MEADDLSEAQLTTLFERLGPHVLYLRRQRDRMAHLGFEPDDELRMLVKRAHHAIHALAIDVHYRSCADHTGRKPRAK